MATKGKNLSVAEYITAQISLCGRSQIDIATDTGFDKPNVITMIKQGKTKLPIDKCGKFATAIGVDPVYLYKMCMAEYYPDTAKELERVFGNLLLTKNEMEIIKTVRRSDIADPEIRSDGDRAALLKVINNLGGAKKAEDA